MNWFFAGIADKIIDSLDRLLSFFQKIDLWWETKSSDKKKNIRNNFQKFILCLMILAVHVYDTKIYNTDIDRIGRLQDLTQKNLDNCVKEEVERLKAENKKYEKVVQDSYKLQLQVELLKQELKKDKR